jgi:hypothetical protein
MTEMIREPNLIAVGEGSDKPVRRRFGVAFVPCAICSSPVDLAAIADDEPQLCAGHRVGDFLPLQ